MSRGAEPLAETLGAVAAAMAGVRGDWWVIGSAAVRLHGVATSVADVDLLIGIADADAVEARTGAVLAAGTGDARFRSARFGCWREGAMPVEIMAGLCVRDAGGWSPVALRTREVVSAGDATVYVPARGELVALLRRFGREKDLARAALLERRG